VEAIFRVAGAIAAEDRLDWKWKYRLSFFFHSF
jgi:hypothetical protein